MKRQHGGGSGTRGNRAQTPCKWPHVTDATPRISAISRRIAAGCANSRWETQKTHSRQDNRASLPEFENAKTPKHQLPGPDTKPADLKKPVKVFILLGQSSGSDRVSGAHPDRVSGAHLGSEDGHSGQERQTLFTRTFDPSSSSSTPGSGSSRHSSRKWRSGGSGGPKARRSWRSPWKIWPHSLNGRLLVTRMLPRS